jgi:hypothetical protein
MPMQTFREGAIELRFPGGWNVLKYDDPTAECYQSVKRIGADLSAVDFVVNPHETPASRLLLIEVKDFRQYEVANRARLRPGALAVEIARNALHTLAILYTGVRARHRTLRGLESAVLPAPETLQLVLLLEEDPLPEAGRSGHMSSSKMFERENRQKLRAQVQTELQQRLAGFGITTEMYFCAGIPRRDGWEATALQP